MEDSSVDHVTEENENRSKIQKLAARCRKQPFG